MTNQFHILNGDSLKSQFPESLKKNIIVTRECLIDGDVFANSLKEFYSNRANFLSGYSREVSTERYYTETVSEFTKIQNIQENDTINLWFEDDLFCQVNFWFVVNLINRNKKKYNVYLVRPNSGNEYNFGNMTENELIQAFYNRINLCVADLNNIENLWNFYQQKNWAGLQNLASNIQEKFPFILPAVQAQLERNPENFITGRPYQTLRQIIGDLGTAEFKPVFSEFCIREPIYGFGDLQVKRMLNKIVKPKKNE